MLYHLISCEGSLNLTQERVEFGLIEMVFNFFSKKKEQKETEKKEENKESEEENLDQKNIKRNQILAYSINSKEELRQALDDFKNGRLTLVGIEGIKKKNKGKARDLVRELLSITKKRKGQILGVGRDHLLLAPKNFSLSVKKGKESM